MDEMNEHESATLPTIEVDLPPVTINRRHETVRGYLNPGLTTTEISDLEPSSRPDLLPDWYYFLGPAFLGLGMISGFVMLFARAETVPLFLASLACYPLGGALVFAPTLVNRRAIRAWEIAEGKKRRHRKDVLIPLSDIEFERFEVVDYLIGRARTARYYLALKQKKLGTATGHFELHSALAALGAFADVSRSATDDLTLIEAFERAYQAVTELEDIADHHPPADELP